MKKYTYKVKPYDGFESDMFDITVEADNIDEADRKIDKKAEILQSSIQWLTMDNTFDCESYYAV